MERIVFFVFIEIHNLKTGTCRTASAHLLLLSRAPLHVLLEGLALGNVGLLGLRVVRVELGRLRVTSVRLGLCKNKREFY